MDHSTQATGQRRFAVSAHRSLIRHVARGFRGWLLRPSSAKRKHLEEVLARWSLARPRIVRRVGSIRSTNWLVEAEERRLLLHQAHSSRDYIDYQLDAVEFLRAAGFSLELPTFLPTARGERYHDRRDGCWTLRDWMAGSNVTIPSEAAVQEIAACVGAFDRIMARFNHGHPVGRFQLAIFDNEGSRQPPLSTFTELRRQLVERDGEKIRRLPIQTIYNDWHPWNLIGQDNALTGLIDFDSLVEAPRILDLANALSYCLILSDLPVENIYNIFIETYIHENPISLAERAFVRTPLVDHLIQLDRRLAPKARLRNKQILYWVAQQEGIRLDHVSGMDRDRVE